MFSSSLRPYIPTISVILDVVTQVYTADTVTNI